jgi:ankyrin repeat protein
VVTILVDRGVDFNRQSDGGWTALHYAAGNQHPEIVHLLLEAEARPDVRNSLGETPLDRAWAHLARTDELLRGYLHRGAGAALKQRRAVTEEIINQLGAAIAVFATRGGLPEWDSKESPRCVANLPST